MIEFPKTTIQNIEMFVAEIPCNLVNVFLFVHQGKGVKEIGSPNLPRRDSSRMAFVHRIEYASNNGDSVFLLELGVVRKKFQALRNR